MSDNTKYKYYLYDLGLLIKERALQAIKRRSHTPENSKDNLYQSGRIMAFGEVISIMQQQAEGFGISLKDLRLEDIDPDKDLV